MSTGRGKVNSRLVTPPVEVITTTISTWGWRASTSTWRIVEVSIGGAVTIASRLVTCDSVSVVTRIASSSSRRTRVSDSGGPGERLGEQAVDEVAVAGLGGDAAGPRVRVGQQPQLLEIGQLVADRRRPPFERGAQRLGAHGGPGVEVFLDQAAQDELLAFGQHPSRL